MASSDDAPGMYVLGLSVLRRRGSSYIGGAARDTAELAAHVHLALDAHVDHGRRTCAFSTTPRL